MSARDVNQAVTVYYDRNTLPFLRFGGSGVALGAIHREVWAPGVQTSSQAFEYVNHQVKAFCLSSGAPSAQHLLDLGCGVGGTATWLAASANCRVHGVTLSPIQAELATRRAQELGLSELCHFQVADMTALDATVSSANLPSRIRETNPAAPARSATRDNVTPAGAGTYTGAYAIESLIHVADAHAFFECARRILPAGAPLLVCDDFLSPRVESAATAAQTRDLECFKQGWRAFGLRGVAQVKQFAEQFGFQLRLEQNLTPHLRCVPSWVTTPGAWLLRLPGLRGEYWDSLRGSTALQNCIRQGLTEYRLLVWSAPGKRA